MRILVLLVSTLICTSYSSNRVPNFYDLGCKSRHIASGILKGEDFRKIDRSLVSLRRSFRLPRRNRLM
jgi:hypothetical protein